MTKSNTEVENEFFTAIKCGHVQLVRDMVASQPELLQAYDYQYFGATPLTCVTFKDDREMIETLCELGADLNRRSDWEMGPWSPLHSAIHSNKMELARFLLDKGAELDIHTAAAMGHIADLNRMLDESPERVGEPGGDGCQPLHFAGTTAAAQLLLDRGADLEARCLDHYSTPVHYLADSRPEIAKYLIRQGARPDIFSAILAGDIETIEALIDQDPGVLNLKIDQETFPSGPEHDVHNIMTFTVGLGCTPLHAAAKGNQTEVIALLVKRGSDPNIRGGYDDAMPLHQAAWQDHFAAANALISYGADINALSGEIHNNSAAGWAIVAGSADVFCCLMDHGAEVKEFFLNDAIAAVNGEFREYKVVPQENYDRILARLRQQ